MVGVVELESTTSTMSTWRSNQLSYTPSFLSMALIYHPSEKYQAPFVKKLKKSTAAVHRETAAAFYSGIFRSESQGDYLLFRSFVSRM